MQDFESPQLPPELARRYIVRELVAEGTFGRVFRADDTQLHRDVAVKVAFQERDSLSDEAIRAAQLHHPAIATVYEVGLTSDGFEFVIYRYVSGITLADLLAETRINHHRMRWQDIAVLVKGVAEGLASAHQAEVVHRDIKPSNIILEDGRSPVIIDFGIGLSALEGNSPEPPRILGTPPYLSPEQARGQARSIDGRSDIFALGTVLYELLTLKPPFEDRRAVKLFRAGRRDRELVTELATMHGAPAQPVLQLAPDVPPALADVCSTALAINADDRYPTAEWMVRDLNEFLRTFDETLELAEGTTFPVRAAAEEIEPPKPTRKPARWVVVTAVVAIAMAFAVKAILFSRSPRSIPLELPAIHGREELLRHWQEVTPPKTEVFPQDCQSPSADFIDHTTIVLRNRAFVVSRNEYSSGVVVQFRWMWTEGKGLYSDNLALAVRSDGIPRRKWSHEVNEGVVIRLVPNGNLIEAFAFVGDQARAEPLGKTLNLRFPRDVWHEVRVVDDYKTIDIYLDSFDAPIFSIPRVHNGTSHRVAIYNREPVGGTDKESIISQIAIYSLDDDILN